MTATPFLSVLIRARKDAVLVRTKARQVASLLCYTPVEQACIAAGTFVVACQALRRLGPARVCFQIEDHYLHVFARATGHDRHEPPASRVSRISSLLGGDGDAMVRLVKPLPPDQALAEPDVAWLLRSLEQNVSAGLFEEFVKQNQEILTLLHELQVRQATLEQNGGAAENAA
jgi:hypothetical protein